MYRIRKQLTLFVDAQDAVNIEMVRAKYNPQQKKLINSHVTLCREDELIDIEKVIENLVSIKFPPLTIVFGAAARFHEGQGVLLPAKGDTKEFQNLRSQVLKGISPNPRTHEPHITLMHPRNSTCNDAIFEEIYRIILPAQITFRTISLIEQVGEEPWRTLKDFNSN